MKNFSTKNRLKPLKPLILALETSGRLGSVALAEGPIIIAESAFSGPMRHSAEIFPAVCDMLDKSEKKSSQIEQIYISIGPGSFTGLRIAVTIAKMMHFANNTKIIQVDTMNAIAANFIDFQSPEKQKSQKPSPFPQITRIATILDAKRGQFYVGVYQYEKGLWQKSTETCLMTTQDFLGKFADADNPIYLLGEGLLHYQEIFKSKGTRILDEEYWQPTAKNIHLLGWQLALKCQFSDPFSLQPAYLRCPDAKPKQR